MRYRPFNQAGLAVSAITLTLNDAPLSEAQRQALVFAALEAGINSFELYGLSPDWNAPLRAAIEVAGQNVLVLTLRAPKSQGPEAIAEAADLALMAQIEAARDQIGVDRFDAILVDALLLDDGSPSQHGAALVKALRDKGLAGLVGVTCGRGGPTPDMMQAGYDVLATPFGLQADAGLRKRLRTLVEHQITPIGYDFYDVGAATVPAAEAPKGLARLFKRAPVAIADTGPYEFLHRTPGWGAEEIALAYALTEPSLATVRVETTDLKLLNRLAKAVERELPAGAAAQIEMARFSAPA
jgi:aryl-alcohol dehydrogenase-like predicted oxidoreductase